MRLVRRWSLGEARLGRLLRLRTSGTADDSALHRALALKPDVERRARAVNFGQLLLDHLELLDLYGRQARSAASGGQLRRVESPGRGQRGGETRDIDGGLGAGKTDSADRERTSSYGVGRSHSLTVLTSACANERPSRCTASISMWLSPTEIRFVTASSCSLFCTCVRRWWAAVVAARVRAACAAGWTRGGDRGAAEKEDAG